VVYSAQAHDFLKEDLQLDPHVVQVIRIKMRADQANTREGDDDKNTNNSQNNHGDFLS
jgi:hypothetical protein